MPRKKIEKIIVDGNDTSEYSIPKLQEFCMYMLQKLDFVRKDRNFFQVQCSQMRTAWELARVKLEETRSLIRTTRLKKDCLDEDSGYIDKMKSFVNESKFLTREKKLQIEKIVKDTNTEMSLMDTKWNDEVLMDMLESKLDLKVKNDEELATMVKKRMEFDEQIELDLDGLCTKLDEESGEVFQKEESRLEKAQARLELMAENSLIRVQEEYNKLFFLMKSFGESHFSTIRNFSKKVMDDDVAMILVMKKEVSQLAKTVQEKKEYCSQLKEQLEHLRETKGMLEAAIRRLQNKVKNRRVKLSNCEKSESKSVRMANEAKSMSDEYTTKQGHLKKLHKQETALTSFIHQGFLEAHRRQEEVLTMLTQKCQILSNIAQKDEMLAKEAMADIESDARGLAEKQLRELRTTSAASLGELVLDIARECNKHDRIVEMANAHLTEKELCGLLEKINFQATIQSL